MNVIVVDDEPLALASLLKKLKEVLPEEAVRGFTEPTQALAAMRGEPADVAFLDIQMAGMDGLELALCFKTVHPALNVIFVTAYSEYALQAIKMRASGYILKPATARAIREELDNLRVFMPAMQRVVVRTFGNFEVFVDGKPLHFARSKSKELFALLVDRRGAGETASAACALLWPNTPYDFSRQRQFQTVVSEMTRAFAAENAERVILRRRNFLAVDTSMLDCDLYRMLHGDVKAINTFRGEYMRQYAWASFRLNG